MKKLGLGPKMILSFLVAIAGSVVTVSYTHLDVYKRQDVYWLNILGIMEYLTSGITSNFDMYFFPPVDAKASADTGFRTVQTSGLNNFGGTVELMEENYHIVNEMSDLTSFIVGFHAEYTTSKELMEGVAALAQKLKSPVWLHNSETKLEVAECKERWGMTPTQLTDSLGMYEYGGGGSVSYTHLDVYKRQDDVFHILEQILYEFPVARMEFYIPKWTEMLPPDHPMKAEIIQGARTILGGMRKVKDIYAQDFTPEHYVSRMKLEEVDLACLLYTSRCV